MSSAPHPAGSVYSDIDRETRMPRPEAGEMATLALWIGLADRNTPSKIVYPAGGINSAAHT